MGGCCCGNIILKMNEDIINNSDIIKNEQVSYKEPFIQSGKYLDKEETKKEKEKVKSDNLKTEIDDKKMDEKNKNIGIHISSKSHPVSNNNNIIYINKKKMLKKGSDRVHEALNKLKLLTIKDMNNNTKFFT